MQNGQRDLPRTDHHFLFHQPVGCRVIVAVILDVIVEMDAGLFDLTVFIGTVGKGFQSGLVEPLNLF